MEEEEIANETKSSFTIMTSMIKVISTHLGNGRAWREVSWLSARSSSSRFCNGERREGASWSIEFPAKHRYEVQEVFR